MQTSIAIFDKLFHIFMNVEKGKYGYNHFGPEQMPK